MLLGSCARGMQSLCCGAGIASCAASRRRAALPQRPLHCFHNTRTAASSSGAGDVASQEAPPEAGPEAYTRPFRPGETAEIHLKGVTFGDRQTAVSALTVGTPVLLVREPENEADAGAVAVLSSTGTSLGYVPRHLTEAFVHDTTPGRVAAVGRNEAGIWWAVAHTKPVTPGLAADLCPVPAGPEVPASFRATPNLSQLLSGSIWDTLRRDAYKRANLRCVVCDAPKEGPGDLRAIEVWRHDPALRVSRLRSIHALCTACHGVARLRRDNSSSSGGRGSERQVQQLQKVNGWDRGQAEGYIAWVHTERSRRAALGPWTADCSLLRESRWGVSNLVTEQMMLVLNGGVPLPARTEQKTASAEWGPEPPF